MAEYSVTAALSGSGTVKLSAGNGLHMITASVPVASLPPGDSIVRARLLVDGAPVGTLVRALRKAAQ